MRACVTTAVLLVTCLPAQAQGPAVLGMSVDPARVAQYERVSLTFRLGRDYATPFDPAQIEVNAEIQGPGDQRLLVPAFWIEPQEPADDFTTAHVFTSPGVEHYRPAGEAHWQVRFTLTKPGTWQGRVRARDAGGESVSDEFSVKCVPDDAPGYLQAAPNRHFLCFDSGTGFVPVGFCIAWARGRSDRDTYDDYFRRLTAAGGNTVRVWMCHWAWLEWTKGSSGALLAYDGAGRYNQQVAYNFDRIVALAEKHGLYLQLCLSNACWEMGRPDGKNNEYDSWGGHPYNVKNGGPCQEPEEIWSNEDARQLYRNRLRYLVARWAYSPNILAWELWNELGSESDASARWHHEMAGYLRSVDPYQHPVTTSTWLSDVRELPRTFAAMDLVQLHYAAERSIKLAREAFPSKPLIIGEGPWDRKAAVRSAYTSPLLGAAGPPLTWHAGPDSPVETEGFYSLVTSVADYWRGFPATADKVTRLTVTNLRAETPGGPAYAPVVIEPGFNTWLKKAGQAEFVVPPNGAVETVHLSDRLYGSNADRAPFRNPPIFIVDYPVDGTFSVAIKEVSGPAVLLITLDDVEVLCYTVPGEGRRPAPAEETWQTIRVPAGKHRIRVDNAGSDWMAVGPFVLGNYRDLVEHPPVTALGLAADDEARIWIANDWASTANGITGSAKEITVQMTWEGLVPGEWLVVWSDPATGKTLRQETCRAERRGLKLKVTDLRDQVAAKLRRIGG